MGNAPSDIAATATRFSPPEKGSGSVIAAFLHREPGGEEVVVVGYRDSLCQYNPLTADRRARADAISPFTSAAYSRQTLAGSLLAVGTMAGTVELYAPFSLRHRATLRRREDVEASAVVDRPVHGSILPVTCTAFLGHDTIVAGTSSGSVHLFSLRTGREVAELVQPIFEPIEPSKQDGEAAVGSDGGAAGDRGPPSSSATVCAVAGVERGAARLLVVGYGDGQVHAFNRESGAWVQSVEVPADAGPAASLTTLPAWNLLLYMGLHSPRLVLWDVRSLDSPAVLDTEAAAGAGGAAAPKRRSLPTALAVDAERGLLLCGAHDGSFVIRQLWRGDEAHAAAQEERERAAEAAANAAAVSLRTVRLFAPANRAAGGGRTASSAAAAAAAAAAAWITSVHYAAEEDVLVLGDAAGFARQVRGVTGQAPSALTPALASAIERHRSARREALRAALRGPSLGHVRRRVQLARKGPRYASLGAEVRAASEDDAEGDGSDDGGVSSAGGGGILVGSARRAQAGRGGVADGGLASDEEADDDADLFLAEGAPAAGADPAGAAVVGGAAPAAVRGGRHRPGTRGGCAGPGSGEEDEVERAVESIFGDSSSDEEVPSGEGKRGEG